MINTAQNLSDTVRVAWSVNEWASAVGIGKSTAWLLLQRGDIPSIKVGAKRLIVISPATYVERRASGAA